MRWTDGGGTVKWDKGLDRWGHGWGSGLWLRQSESPSAAAYLKSRFVRDIEESGRSRPSRYQAGRDARYQGLPGKLIEFCHRLAVQIDR